MQLCVVHVLGRMLAPIVGLLSVVFITTPAVAAEPRDMVYDAADDLGWKMRAVIAGDPQGQRVVFVHGTPGSFEAWEDYLASVPQGFEYVAIDRLGFGESDPKEAVISFEHHASSIKPLLVTRNGRKTILVGHSLGGPIIAFTAATYSEDVGAIVSAAGSFDPNLEEILFIQHVGDMWPIRPMLPRAIRNANHEIFGHEDELKKLSPLLSELEMPVIIIQGTDDDLVPYENVAYLKETFQPDQPVIYVELKDQNHFLPWNSKDVIDQAILDAAEASNARPINGELE